MRLAIGKCLVYVSGYVVAPLGYLLLDMAVRMLIYALSLEPGNKLSAAEIFAGIRTRQKLRRQMGIGSDA